MLPETIAGAIERAGFMEAPHIGPANMASNPTTDATAIPAVIPFSFAPVETFIITNIKKKVSMVSRTKDCISLPAGMVTPKFCICGNINFKERLAKKAPTNWHIIYIIASLRPIRSAAAKASDTAGLRCSTGYISQSIYHGKDY